MNDFPAAVTAELERLAPRRTPRPDWEDVLARAGVRRRRARVTALPIAAALAAVALLATPALGLQSTVRSLLGIDGRRGPQFVAQLRPVAGSGSGTIVARPLSTFTTVGSKRTIGFSQSLRVTLRFTGLSGPATSARFRVAPPRGSGQRGYVVRLCAPCRSGAVLLVRRRGLILVLITGRVTAELATTAHPDGELRGQVRARF